MMGVQPTITSVQVVRLICAVQKNPGLQAIADVEEADDTDDEEAPALDVALTEEIPKDVLADVPVEALEDATVRELLAEALDTELLAEESLEVLEAERLRETLDEEES